MKRLSIAVVFLVSGCGMQDQSVIVQKYEMSMNAPSFLALPDGACRKSGGVYECEIHPKTRVKWGLGFCDNSRSKLRARVKNSEISLIVNGAKVPESKIYSREEKYDRSSYQYCHEWHVLLSDWNQNSTLYAVDSNGYIEETRVALAK